VPLTYVWTQNNSVLGTVTGGTLRLNNVTVANAGEYAVTVSVVTYGSATAKTQVQVANVSISEQPQRGVSWSNGKL